MNYLILLFLIGMSTAIWPVNRWVMKNGGRPESVGLVISLISSLACLFFALISGKEIFIKSASIYGMIMGIAYAVGFCLIIIYCLKIGPSGPTTVMNNLGAIAPIVIELIWFSGKRISFLAVIGLLSIVFSMILLSLDNKPGTLITRKWIILVIIGWAFSCISMASQFLSSQTSADSVYAFVISGFMTSFIILLFVQFGRENGLPNKSEVIGGVITGLLNAVSFPVYFLILNRIPAAVVFPVTVAGPAIIMLLISHFFLKEKLNSKGWVACMAGVVGILILAIFK